MNSKDPLMSWPCARKVLAAVSRTAVLGVVAGAGVAGDELAGAGELACVAGALDVTAAEGLAWELQAVTSRAAQAMPAQPATCRARRPFVINMISNPSTLNFPNRLAKAWHLHDGGATATTGGALCRGW
jgi:hypothetical protein